MAVPGYHRGRGRWTVFVAATNDEWPRVGKGPVRGEEGWEGDLTSTVDAEIWTREKKTLRLPWSVAQPFFLTSSVTGRAQAMAEV